MKKGKAFGQKKKVHHKKNPGKNRRMEEKQEASLLRGERIPGTRRIPDKRREKTEERMEKETRIF